MSNLTGGESHQEGVDLSLLGRGLIEASKDLIGEAASIRDVGQRELGFQQELADAVCAGDKSGCLDGAGEMVYALACPPDPDAQPVQALTEYAGVRLLKELVCQTVAAPRLDETDTRAMAKIAKQSDGLPLALELARPASYKTALQTRHRWSQAGLRYS